jgi:Uma2 family endonuclease
MSAAIAARPVTYGLEASWARFPLAKYQQMIETGIVDKNDQVEHLEGYVVLKMPRNPAHDGTIDLGKAALWAILPPGWLLRVQQAVTLADSQPEPDFAIVRGNPRSYLVRHPGPADVGLIIEVADSSLLRDTADKARIYARAGISCYWVIDLVARAVEVYSQPSGPTPAPTYASRVTIRPPDAISLMLDGNPVAAVPVTDLLP